MGLIPSRPPADPACIDIIDCLTCFSVTFRGAGSVASGGGGMTSSSGAGGCLRRSVATTSSVGCARVSLEVSTLRAAPMSPSAHRACTLRATASLELGSVVVERFRHSSASWSGRWSSRTCRLISVASVQFRTDFGSGDLSALNANEKNRHQASGLVHEIASLMRFDKLSATTGRAGFGMSLMIGKDRRSCANDAGMSLGCSLQDVSDSVSRRVVVCTKMDCDFGGSSLKQGGQCQMARERA